MCDLKVIIFHCVIQLSYQTIEAFTQPLVPEFISYHYNTLKII